MPERMEGGPGENHAGELHRERVEQKAARIIGQELAHPGWEEQDLAHRPKNDPGKLAVAGRLRKETTLPLKPAPAYLPLRKGSGACFNSSVVASSALLPEESSCTPRGRTP